jgi:hypothetical protein
MIATIVVVFVSFSLLIDDVGQQSPLLCVAVTGYGGLTNGMPLSILCILHG